MSLDRKILIQLSEVVDKQLGLYFPVERHKDLERAMGYAAQDLSFDGATECVQWLLYQAEAQVRHEILARYLTIGETYFFRDKKIFTGLNRELIPEILRNESNAKMRDISIWSAACSTGEEPYTIAISLSQMSTALKEWNVKILATDINADSIKTALAGRYSEWSFRDVPTNIVKTYFDNLGGSYRLRPEIRKKVTFAETNLANDNFLPPGQGAGSMDIIFCRNVLIYFDRERRNAIVNRLTQCLKVGGFLVTSPSELGVVVEPNLKIKRLKCGVTVFQKIPSPVTKKIEKQQDSPLAARVGSIPNRSLKRLVVRPMAVTSRVTTLLQKDPTCRKYLVLFEEGNYPKIVEELGPLVQNRQKCGDLTEAEAMLLLAETYANLGNYKEALKLGLEVVQKDKINPSHYFFLATLYIELDRSDLAIGALNKSIFLDHHFVMAYFTLATISPAEKAQKHLRTVLSILSEKSSDEIIPFSDGMRVDHLMEITVAMGQNREPEEIEL